MPIDFNVEINYSDVAKVQSQLVRAAERAFVQDYEGFIAQSKRAIDGARQQLEKDDLREEDEAQYKRMIVDMEMWIIWAQDQIRAIHERFRQRRSEEEAARHRASG